MRQPKVIVLPSRPVEAAAVLWEENEMALTRRQALKSGVAVAAVGISMPAIAQKSPIQVGYLPALTGPSSSTGVGINRGTSLPCRRSTRPAASTAARSS
jgi:hypothetical protein